MQPGSEFNMSPLWYAADLALHPPQMNLYAHFPHEPFRFALSLKALKSDEFNHISENFPVFKLPTLIGRKTHG